MHKGIFRMGLKATPAADGARFWPGNVAFSP